jgi:hypothetical protein
MEETMRELTITELWRLTPIELSNLVTRIANELPTFPEDSPERTNALASLRNTCWRGEIFLRDPHGKGGVSAPQRLRR